jgi:uncharacterized protein (TIGR00369 family)
MKMAKFDDAKLNQRREQMLALFDRAPIKRTMGIDFYYDQEGSAVFELPYNPGFDHPLDAVHGGAIATLLDNAGWFTVAPYYDNWVSTAEMQIRLLKPAHRAHLRSKGRVLSIGKRVAMAEMEVTTKDGVLIAKGSGTFVVTTQSTEKDKS